MIKQITDLEPASTIELNKDCQFVMDNSQRKTRRVSFGDIKNDVIQNIPIATENNNGLITVEDKKILNDLSSENWTFEFADGQESLTANIVINKLWV